MKRSDGKSGRNQRHSASLATAICIVTTLAGQRAQATDSRTSAASANATAAHAAPAGPSQAPTTNAVALPQRTPSATALRYDTDYPLIPYAEKPAHNAIARLQERIDRGEVKLQFNSARGYLDSILTALGIDPSSQTLVYSKTSLQIDAIRAATPRAIYFDDDTYVAWVQGSNFLEITTMDSVLGPVFYTLPKQEAATASFDRETLRCLTCHDTFSLLGGGVPRFLFMSSPVTVGGEPLTPEISAETTDATPLQERWGGWYVTGQHDGLTHLGNIQVQSAKGFKGLDRVRRGTLESLAAVFDTRPYVTDKSDIVALLVFEHQVYVENLITRATFKTRTVLANQMGGQPADALSWEELPPKSRQTVKAMLEPLVQAMLFTDAAALPAQITGNSGFDEWFQSKGKRDARGRSLKDLDLHTRLFKYPLSYLVYSDGFDGLPGYAKEYVYGRFAEILSGRDQGKAYSHLAADDRAAILEILAATKPAFAAATQIPKRTSPGW